MTRLFAHSKSAAQILKAELLARVRILPLGQLLERVVIDELRYKNEW